MSFGFKSKLTRSIPIFGQETSQVPYASRMFTLLVGPAQMAMTVHEDFLKKSPFFAAICSSNFLEGDSGIIKLEDDDPIHLKLVIDFLCSGNFDCRSVADGEQKRALDIASAQGMTDDSFPNEPETTEVEGTEPPTSDPAALSLLAGVYVLAEKYQLSGLLVLCLYKMRPCIDVSADPEAFLECASVVYRGTPESDQIFRPYFRDHCPAMLMGFDEENEDRCRILYKAIAKAGDLAVDIFKAHRNLHMIQKYLEPDSEDCWIDPSGPISAGEISKIFDQSLSLQKMKGQRLQFEHAVFHPRCRTHVDDSEAVYFHRMGLNAYGRPTNDELVEDRLMEDEPVGDRKQSPWERLKTYLGAFRGFSMN